MGFKILVAVIGTAVVVAGIIMLPAPGPGWLVILAGLGILATEFAAARRVLVWVRDRYLAWVSWVGRQNLVVRSLVMLGILVLVAVCAWLVGAFSLMASWFGLDLPWLASPIAWMP
jgi:uncharacterized protein (TIGR02611 family)